jgi:hypothetical protein
MMIETAKYHYFFGLNSCSGYWLIFCVGMRRIYRIMSVSLIYFHIKSKWWTLQKRSRPDKTSLFPLYKKNLSLNSLLNNQKSSKTLNNKIQIFFLIILHSNLYQNIELSSFESCLLNAWKSNLRQKTKKYRYKKLF